MNIPCAEPQPVSTAEPDECVQTRLFALNGRIGRMRYLAYVAGLSALAGVTGSQLTAFWQPNAYTNLALVIAIAVLGNIPPLILMLILTRRRIHDINLRGWYMLLLLLPYINLVMVLILVVMPGSKGSNKFGRPPSSNPWWVWLVAIIPLAIIVMIAGFFMPGYKMLC